MMGIRGRSTAALTLAAALAVGSVSFAAGQGSADAGLQVCVKKSNGSLRAATKCAGNERSLTIGARGPSGAPGAGGATGPAGPAGAPGADGSAGATGERGPAGETGPQGVSGGAAAKGDKGATGDRGPAGATGATGATGPRGISAGKIVGLKSFYGLNATSLTSNTTSNFIGPGSYVVHAAPEIQITAPINAVYESYCEIRVGTTFIAGATDRRYIPQYGVAKFTISLVGGTNGGDYVDVRCRAGGTAEWTGGAMSILQTGGWLP